MRNRAIQMKIVNTKNQETEALPEDIRLQDKAVIVTTHLEKVIDKVAAGVLAYVVVDTIRKVIIAKASK